MKEPMIDAEVIENFEPAEKMGCDGRAFASHERDCNKYYICQYAKLVEQR